MLLVLGNQVGRCSMQRRGNARESTSEGHSHNEREGVRATLHVRTLDSSMASCKHHVTTGHPTNAAVRRTVEESNETGHEYSMSDTANRNEMEEGTRSETQRGVSTAQARQSKPKGD